MRCRTSPSWQRSPLCRLFIIIVIPSSTTLTSGNHQSAFYHHNCIISRVLQTWNHTECGLLSLAFSLRMYHWNQSKWLYVSIYLFLLLVNGILWYEYTPVCLNTHLLREILVVFSLRMFQIKWLRTILYRFLCRHRFSFPWGEVCL